MIYRGKWFIIITKIKELENIVECNFKEEKVYLDKEIIKDKSEENLRAIVRGVFLGSGSINNPKNKYHLEVNFSNKLNMEIIEQILNILTVKIKTMKTKSKYSMYIKEGEEISKFLALIGANKAVMQFEDIRIQREMRGKVNRLVNCETANLNKTINASIEQIAAIKKLQQNGEFNKLDDNLKEIAILRIENPNMSLLELGRLLKNPVGKSGVNYRLKKIIEIAND